MTAYILLLASTLLPAMGGALALHLWQSRPPRVTRAGFAVGQTPLHIRKHAQARRREVQA